MTGLTFISEEDMRSRIVEEGERAKEMGRTHILTPEGFATHLINVGNTNFEVTQMILDRNPDLVDQVDPYVAKATGYFHDFAKIGGNTTNSDQQGGDAWHDLEGPHMLFTRNDELGLVTGGTEEQRKAVLRQMALGISSDYSLAEEMGNDFPRTAAYPVIDGLVERFNQLRAWLSEDGEPISREKIVYPDTVMRKVAQYADMVCIGGGEKELVERLDEIVGRYSLQADEQQIEGNYEKANYFRHQVGIAISPAFRERVSQTIREVERIAGIN